MNGRAHMLMGAASAAPLLLVTRDGFELAGYVAVAVVASLAPDVDQAEHSLAISWPKRLGWALTGKTKRGGKKPPTMLVHLLFFVYLYGLMRLVSKATRYASKTARRVTGTADDRTAWGRTFDPDHRGLTHTGAAALLAGVACGWLADFLGAPWQIGVAVFLGWMSHLLSDACTRAGVPLLWPLPVRGWRIRAAGAQWTPTRHRWRKFEAAGAKWTPTRRRWHRVRLMKRLNLTSCAATDWRVAWVVVALIVTPTVSLYSLTP